MKDKEFIERFESITLPKESFHHKDHVRLAWLYLHRYPVLEAISRFCEGLKRFASAHGKTNLYHETITWSYILLVNERIVRAEGDQNWEEFVSSNGDLFDWENSILKKYYSEETLSSDIARRVFVFPDKNYS